MTYPDPNNTNPSARDGVNLSEAPVGVSSDDGRNELRNGEGTHESDRRTLHEEETMRTGDEDQSLRDDGDLEVDNHVELPVVVVARSRGSAVVERDTEFVVEPSGLDNDRNEGNAREKE